MNPNEIPLWIQATQWCSRSVLLLLVGLSIWSVATMIRCRRMLQTASGEKDGRGPFPRVKALLQEGKVSEILGLADASLYTSVIQKAVKNPSQEPARIDRSVKSLMVLKRTEIEQSLTILATLGSNAPFIGLFGTVLGIIQAFGLLGSNQSNGASVMVGISEALIATAVGLFVAVPAVIAFNFLSRQLRVLLTNCEVLRDLYISQSKGE